MSSCLVVLLPCLDHSTCCDDLLLGDMLVDRPARHLSDQPVGPQLLPVLPAHSSALSVARVILSVCGELPTPLLTVNQLGCTSPLPTVNPVGGVL
jgi:hypothetical protein